jgi:hypothetical protein
MKLIALYTVFNGTELLDGSIERIIEHVDEILVCYQNISNTGTKSREANIWRKSSRYRDKIKFIKWTPDLSKSTKQNEVDKHNFMLSCARRNGFTHHILMACDHYYDTNQFAAAKQQLIDQPLDVTVTTMYTYYKHMNWRLEPIESYCMPFICRIREGVYFHYGVKYPVKTDPSVVMTKCDSFGMLSESEIMLHHYSMIRTDIHSKFKNAAASIRWKPEQIKRFISEYENAQPGDSISYFQGRTITVV